MKIKLIAIFVISISYITVINSCTIDRCFGIGVSGESVFISFKNTAGIFLYSGNLFNNPYLTDSLKVFDENNIQKSFGKNLEQDTHTSLTTHFKFFLEAFNNTADSKAYDTEVCKKIYFKHHYNETDTIQACFKMFKNKCNTATYEYLNIYYKGKMVGSISNQEYIEVTITK